jgi:hypothetical protein
MLTSLTGMKNRVPMVRIHNVRLKGTVKGNLPTNHMGEWKVYFTNTWKGYAGRFSDDGSIVAVLLTPKSAILYFSVAAAPTLDEAETKLGNMVGWIIAKLAREGIYITNLRQNTKASYASIYDPIAEEFFKHKVFFDGSTFSIDHSHAIPETEFHSKKGFERYQKFLSYIGDGSIDPEILKEVQEKFKEKENELVDKYDKETHIVTLLKLMTI